MKLNSTNYYRYKKSGFSLIELMIVIVVTGVLSAVAVPIYSNGVMKAKLAEADGALSSISNYLRIYYAENGKYPKQIQDEHVIGSYWNDIASGELTGQYFSDSSYTYQSTNGLQYKVICAGGDILEKNRILKEDGDLDFD